MMISKKTWNGFENDFYAFSAMLSNSCTLIRHRIDTHSRTHIYLVFILFFDLIFFFVFFHFTHFALAVLFIFKLSTSDISELSRSPVIIFPVPAGCCCCCCCGGCCCCGCCCCRCTCCSEFCCCSVSPGLLLV